jgi:Raf kinase inhibitor-like YbhB/YbcL family protein
MSLPALKRTLLPLLALALAAAGCRPEAAEVTPEATEAMSMRVTSTAFGEGEMIPQQYTCDGEDISPPLAWSGAPDGTESFAVIVEDPDAPGGTFIHWVLYDLSADRFRLVEGEQAGMMGANGFFGLGYGGPCPPAGSAHRYFFKIFALDADLDLRPGASAEILNEAMQGHVLAQGQLMGQYER